MDVRDRSRILAIISAVSLLSLTVGANTSSATTRTERIHVWSNGWRYLLGVNYPRPHYAHGYEAEPLPTTVRRLMKERHKWMPISPVLTTRGYISCARSCPATTEKIHVETMIVSAHRSFFIYRVIPLGCEHFISPIRAWQVHEA